MSTITSKFKSWCKDNHLAPTQVGDYVYEVEGKKYLLLEEKDGNVCNSEYEIMLNAYEHSLVKSVDFVLYLWGTRFVYTPVGVLDNPGNENVHIFKYLGETTLNTPGLPFLGVHGPYEILNGTRPYNDWASKAKFLKIDTLGICEKNTLAGTLSFQEVCKKKNLKSVLGETITIKSDTEDLLYEGKLYVINQKGWKNLLLINTEINVNNPSQFIEERKLFELAEGLVFAFNPLFFPFSIDKIKQYQKAFSYCYFQLDSVQYSNESSDKDFLSQTQKYLNNKEGLEPILLCDAYYLDKEDFVVKPAINAIAAHRTFASENQYFKADDENLVLFDKLFKEDDFSQVLTKAIDNLTFVSQVCDFEIETGKFKLPKYKMTSEEKEIYSSSEDMFLSLLMEGYEKLTKDFSGEDKEKYLQRLETEIDVIQSGGFADYFLILWDIVKFCKDKDILTGPGRGSAAGSLVAYCLNITKLDPIKYGLLFERFLNKGRVVREVERECVKINNEIEIQGTEKLSVEGSISRVKAIDLKVGDKLPNLQTEVTSIEVFKKKETEVGTNPDIDIDFESAQRDTVKGQLEQKYGHDKVCSIGTYTTLQMRAIFRDFCKLENIPIGTVEYLSKIMFETRDNKNARASKAPWEYIFKLASRNDTLLKFIQEHPSMIEKTWLCHAQPRAASVHPCATVILPEDESIFTALPIRATEVNGQKLLVSEWEGPTVEKAGYLKEDILGVTQLDKFRMIIDLVRENYGEEIDIYDLPLDEPEVYKMFSEGKGGDVFQLGSKSITAYSTQVKPTEFEELCAILALYRPGPMEGNFHNEYVQLKNGQRDVEYMPGLEGITKNTFGLLAYQEQIMQIVVDLAGFTLSEADDIRKGMGKVDRKFFAEQGQKFMEGALKRGYDKDYLEDLWQKMCSFGGYAFNRCLSGDTQLLRHSNNKISRSSFWPTVGQMWKIKNNSQYATQTGHCDLHWKYRQNGYGTCWSLNERNKLIKNKIVDIRFEGVKPVYKMVLESGKTISTTSNHKFPTNNGEKKLEDINKEVDQIYVSSGYKTKDTTYRWNSEKNYPKQGQKGFQERESEGTKLEKFRQDTRTISICENCECVLEGRDKEIHHIDGNHGNNSEDNLQILCVSCHKRRHYKMGRTKTGEAGIDTHLEKIVSIERSGEEEVYDVEMANPYHTLVTSEGVVASNSHSMCYAFIGYVCQYLKWKYPLPYWITALEFATDDTLLRFIAEINKAGKIKVVGPDVNRSRLKFFADFKKQEIIWSISKVKQCGEVAVSFIFEERDKNGEFFSLEEFLSRVDRSKVNKSVVENLILAGAFDAIEDIKYPSQRKSLVFRYREIMQTKVDKTKDWFEVAREEHKLDFDWWWLLQQKRVSGLAFFDYDSIVSQFDFEKDRYTEVDSFLNDDLSKSDSRLVVTSGVVSEVELRSSKKGDYCRVRLEQNYSFVWFTIWADYYSQFEKILSTSEGKIMIVKARGYYDTYKGENALQSDEKMELQILE
jgi:DNA polymerase-3 subunit alpha